MSGAAIQGTARGSVLVALICLLSACAQGFDPKPIDAVAFRDRAQTQISEGVRVTAAVPSAAASREEQYFFRNGVDPYLSPGEVRCLAIDHHDVDFQAIYATEEITNHDDPEAFIGALQALPCCTTDNASR